MSTHQVPVTFIGKITEHPNADRLELAQVGDTDWQVVVGKGQYKQGDPCIYIPIDSVLPQKLEEILFPEGSKIKLEKSRVRSIKIRGALSQGMVIEVGPELSEELFPGLRKAKMGADVAEILGITKYEPPVRSIPGQMRGQQAPRSLNNPAFTKYTDIENWKHYPSLFQPGEDIYVTEKLHGTSVRYAMLPTHCNTLWKRVKRWLGVLPKYEFCFGSRNIQLQDGRGKQFYSNDVYATVARALRIREILSPGTTLYGEIVGEGIQKGYDYGHKGGEFGFYAYDVKEDGQYLDAPNFMDWCDLSGVRRVPVLFFGPREDVDLDALRQGPSTILDGDGQPTQPVREGVVVKAWGEEQCYMGRKCLKFVNDTYLLKEQTDWH